MTKRSGLILASAIALMTGLAVPPAQARDVLTCEGLKDCFDLQTVCRTGLGSYGQVTYPDGSIWGVCVL